MTITSNRKEGQQSLILHNCQHSGVIFSRGVSHFCKTLVYFFFFCLFFVFFFFFFFLSFFFILKFSLIFMKLKSHDFIPDYLGKKSLAEHSLELFFEKKKLCLTTTQVHVFV